VLYAKYSTVSSASANTPCLPESTVYRDHGKQVSSTVDISCLSFNPVSMTLRFLYTRTRRCDTTPGTDIDHTVKLLLQLRATVFIFWRVMSSRNTHTSVSCLYHSAKHILVLFFLVWAGIAQSVQRLATGWTVRGSNTGGRCEVFRTCPDRPWGPPIQCVPGLFPGGKAAVAWRWPPIPSSAKVKERAELYIYSTFGPS